MAVRVLSVRWLRWQRSLAFFDVYLKILIVRSPAPPLWGGGEGGGRIIWCFNELGGLKPTRSDNRYQAPGMARHAAFFE